MGLRINQNNPNQPGMGRVSSKPTSSGRFVNLQKYLKAGQGGGVQRLGQNVQETVGQTGQQAQKAQQESSNQFAQAVQQSKQGISREQGQQVAQRITQQPHQMSEEQMTEAQKLYNARYGGPKSLQETEYYQPAAQASQKAAETGQLAQSEGGRYQLLRQQFAQPTYTGGQTALDTALLGSDLDVSRGVTGAGQQAVQSGQALEGVLGAAQTQAGQAAQELEDVRSQIQSTVGSESGRTEGEVQDVLSRLQAERQTLLPRLQEMISRGELSADVLSKTNLGDIIDQELYGTDIGGLTGPELTKQTVASKEQAARLGALSKIAGRESGYDPTLAGSIDPNKQFQFDVNRIKEQAAQRKGQYEQALSSAAQEYDRAWLGSQAGQDYQYHGARAAQEQRLSDLVGKMANSQPLSAEEDQELRSLAGNPEMNIGGLFNQLARSPAGEARRIAEDFAQRAAGTRARSQALQAARDAQYEAAKRAVGQQFGVGRRLRLLAGG